MGNRKQRSWTTRVARETAPRPFADGTTSLALGLIAAALLSSLAAAGLNTLNVSRILLFFACIIGLLFIAKSHVLSLWSIRAKLTAAVALTILLFVTERTEAYFQPESPRFPRPPLMLTIRPVEFAGLTRADFIQLKSLPLGIASIARPEGGYPAFNFDNSKDQVMFGIGDVTIYNMAERPITLDAYLDVEGPGVHLRLSGDGHGDGVSQLNENDWLALQEQRSNSRVKLQWMLTPLTIAPQSVVHGPMAFVVPNDVDNDLREKIVNNEINEGYRYRLILNDRTSGISDTITLPLAIR